jgi:hypothetical protein
MMPGQTWHRDRSPGLAPQHTKKTPGVVPARVRSGIGELLLRNARLVLFGNVPDDEMIMGHGHSGMTRVEIEADMIASAWKARNVCEARKIEILVVINILNRNHVNRCYEPVFAVE